MREKRFTSRIVFHFWRVTNSIKRYTDRSDRILQFQLLNVLVDGCLSLAFPSCSPRYLPLELNFDIKDDNSNKSTPLTSKTASTTTSTTLAATIPWVAPVFFFPPKMALFEGCKTISDIYLLHWFLQNKVVCRGERPPICFFWSGPWSSIKKQSICVLKKCSFLSMSIQRMETCYFWECHQSSIATWVLPGNQIAKTTFLNQRNMFGKIQGH